MPPRLPFLDEALEGLRREGLFRDPRATSWTDGVLNLCSNDYLGFAAEPWPGGRVGGAGAARLVTGSHPVHDAAEAALAAWLGTESALLFSSGYAANLGLLSALAGPGDLVVSDALNHASIIDGCRLSRATVVVAPHLDVAAVDAALRAPARRRFVVTESLFSMDGDAPDLRALRRICDEHGAALLVDEAHAIGVVGPEGAGSCAALGVEADAVVGAFGKAFGLQGAVVAGPERLRSWLWNRARSFVFSTAVSPALAEAILARTAQVRAATDRRARLAIVTSELRAALAAAGARVGGTSHIIPIAVGPADVAMDASARLLERGVLARAIRPPTVPFNTARLRVAASSRVTDDELLLAREAFASLAWPKGDVRFT